VLYNLYAVFFYIIARIVNISFANSKTISQENLRTFENVYSLTGFVSQLFVCYTVLMLCKKLIVMVLMLLMIMMISSSSIGTIFVVLLRQFRYWQRVSPISVYHVFSWHVQEYRWFVRGR